MERFSHPIKFVFSFKSGNKDHKRMSIEEQFDPFAKKNHNAKYLSLVSLVILTTTVGLFINYSSTKFLPETYVELVKVGGLTKTEALEKITEKYTTPQEHQLALNFEADQFLSTQTEKVENFEKFNLVEASTSAQLEAEYNYEQTLTEIMADQQQNKFDWLKQLIFQPNQQKKYSLKIEYNLEKLTNLIKSFKEKFDKDPHPPQVTLEKSGSAQTLVLNPGQNILAVNVDKTIEEITKTLELETTLIDINNKKQILVSPSLSWASRVLSPAERETALKTAQKLVGHELILTYDVFNKKLNDQQLLSFITFPSGFIETKITKQIDSWKESMDRPAQNAEFEFDKQTFKVTKFNPHREGLALDKDQTKNLIETTISDIIADKAETTTITKKLPFVTTSPAFTLEKTNNLGIKERIGFGESYYAHSIPTRIHNVALAAKRINYTLVAPGKEFSFNKTIGEVSAVTGFQSAYVIKNGQTVLGDGGGVCQVSTTLFRALLNAGLNITLRLPHSYRVSYYELNNDPGFDATVYEDNIDLRFINDTDNYVLIYTETDSNNLYMKVELYGTSDGRVATISNYKSWGYSAPPAPIYVPDASLPTGKLKQIDWSASGIKTEFTYTVKDRNGELIRQKTYHSSYQPWAAKYLKGI